MSARQKAARRFIELTRLGHSFEAAARIAESETTVFVPPMDIRSARDLSDE